MSRITAALVGVLFLCPLGGTAEDAPTAAQEIRELKQLMELQMKRIDELTVEVGRLHQSIEARKAAAAPGPAPKHEVGVPPPFSGYTEALKPSMAKGDPPRAEAVKPAPPPREEPKNETAAGVKHLVEKGETLTAIAKRYNVALPDLLKANKNVNDRKLQIGQTLAIPVTANPEPAKPSETPVPDKKENP